MIRRLVNGFVHDLRPPQLHMFLSEADRILSSSPTVFVASPAQETEKDISQRSEFEAVASASCLSCLDAANG